MSIFSRLKKLVDPVQGHLDEYSHLDDAPISPAAEAPDDPDVPPAPPLAAEDAPDAPDAFAPPDAEDARYQCKVCGWRAPDPGYCPQCLADTMRPLKHRRGGHRLH